MISQYFCFRAHPNAEETIESEKFPNFAKEGQNEMTIVDFNSNNDNGVRFTEVTDNFEDDGNFGILDSVRNVKPVSI